MTQRQVDDVGKISIENFGPIDGLFEMSLDQKLTVLIGEQATGKSTIARIMRYCLMCLSMETHNQSDHLQPVWNDLKDAMLQFIRRNYGYGSAKLLDNTYNLSFNPNEGCVIEATFPSHDMHPEQPTIYIPAGRSTIPLLFDSYAAARNIRVDPFFDEFLLFLDVIRKNFRISPHSMLVEAAKFSECKIDKGNAIAAIALMESILKGNYRYEKGNERLHCSNGISVPITLASSGQQEILYILMVLFHALLNPKPYTIIIEEPEAHIFPIAQKFVMELVARVINATGSHVIITTHSPYILTSTNLLMHSAKVENKINDPQTVIDKKARLEPKDVSAYILESNDRFSYRPILDKETGFIDAEEIDRVSEIIDQGMSDLIDLEIKHGL